MAGIQGANQSPRITQRYLNTLAYTGDPSPGVVVSTAQVSGSIVQPYTGQVGGRLTIGGGEASKFSDPAVTPTLMAGVYDYVQFLSTSTASNAPGQVVFLTSTLNVVTPDAGATDSGLIAGITLGTPAKGNYWFIQVAGIAAVKFGTITKTTPVVNDAVFLNTTPSNVADVLADGTTMTPPTVKLLMGVAYGSAPASNTISLVALRNTVLNF